jgi:hypothetical protein
MKTFKAQLNQMNRVAKSFISMMLIFGFVAPSIGPLVASAATTEGSSSEGTSNEFNSSEGATTSASLPHGTLTDVASSELFLMSQQAELRDLQSKIDLLEKVENYGQIALNIELSISVMSFITSVIAARKISAMLRPLSREDLVAFKANPNTNRPYLRTQGVKFYSKSLTKYMTQTALYSTFLLFTNRTALNAFRSAVIDKQKEIEWTLRKIKIDEAKN